MSLDTERDALHRMLERKNIRGIVFGGEGMRGAVARAFGATFVFTNVLIGRDGRIAAKRLHDKPLEDAVAAEIAKNQSSQ